MNLKVIFAIILVNLFLIQGVYALDCQYKDIEYFQVEGDQWYLNNNLLDAGPTFEYQDTGLTTATFKVYNPYDFDITIEIPYKTKSNWYGDGTGSVSGTIPAKEFKIFESSHANGGPVSEPELKIIDPEIIKKHELITKEKEVCKQCEGRDCWGDGVKCTRDSECGSGICNIAEFCGTERYVECPRGLLNCKNESCLSPSTKNVGDAYNCEWECASGVGIDGVCIKNNETIAKEKEESIKRTINWILGIVLTSLVIIIFLLRKHILELIKRKGDLENEILQLKQTKETLKKDIEIGKIDINQLKKKINSAEGEAKRVFEEKLKIAEQKQKARINRISEIDLKLDEKEVEQAIKAKKIKETYEKTEEEYKEKWDNVKPFPDPQASNRLVIINPYLGGYKCFFKKELKLKDYPTSSLVHRWIWEKHNGTIKQGYHIHHKNENKYDNRIENLEEKEGTEHYSDHRNKRVN